MSECRELTCIYHGQANREILAAAEYADAETKRANAAEAKVRRVEAILAAWEAWDGSPGPDGQMHPDSSSPHDRDRLRAALRTPDAEGDS